MYELDYTREEALNRQRLLHNNRCRNCPYRNSNKYTDQCESCPVKEELLSIGQVLDATLPRHEKTSI